MIGVQGPAASRWRRLFLTVGAVVVVGTAAVAARQTALQRVVRDYLVVIEVAQAGRPSADQITILFSNRPAPPDTGPPPPVVFGDDIVQEFSFSASDIVGGRLRFSRRVADRSFADARFVRVVNHGMDGWGGGTISISIDGNPVLSNVVMAPLKGDAARGIQGWNRRTWKARAYWELERPRPRVPVRRY